MIWIICDMISNANTATTTSCLNLHRAIFLQIRQIAGLVRYQMICFLNLKSVKGTNDVLKAWNEIYNEMNNKRAHNEIDKKCLGSAGQGQQNKQTK